jgi:hypothetical protein
MPQRRTSSRSFGGLTIGRMPPVVAVYIVVTIAASIIAVTGLRNEVPILEWCGLAPSLVLRGQLWRLFTWVFFEVGHPINLVFACLSYYWWGSDLAYRWGTTRFVIYTLGLATVVGVIVTGLSLVLPASLLAPFYVTSWPLQDALIILWATYYPTRTINFYMVLPLAGRALITITALGTVLYALYDGLGAFVPHFLAEGIAFAVLRVPSPRMWWLERKLRGMEKRTRATHLRAVPRDVDRDADNDKPDPPSGRWLN